MLAPFGVDLVVSGDSQRATSSSGDGDRARSISDAGSRDSSSGGKSRERSSCHSTLATKAVRHHDSHRFTVRRGTPASARVLADSAAASARTHAISTTTSAYTRRPRNRTDGGVTRRRQPSVAQHRLSRLDHDAAGSGVTDPNRGLRG